MPYTGDVLSGNKSTDLVLELGDRCTLTNVKGLEYVFTPVVEASDFPETVLKLFSKKPKFVKRPYFNFNPDVLQRLKKAENWFSKTRYRKPYGVCYKLQQRNDPYAAIYVDIDTPSSDTIEGLFMGMRE